MSNELQQKPKTIQGYLDDPKIKNQIAICLPKHMSVERVTRIALTEIRKNPYLLQCDQASLLKAVVQASSLGLEIGNNLGHAYLIPYKKEVTLIVGYKGLIALARRSGEIESIAAYAVYENDLFEFEYGLEERLKHIPAKNNRGSIIGFYGYAKFIGGGHQMEVMWREEVDAIRDASANYKWKKPEERGNTIWGQHYEEMGRKTVIRRLAKYLPMSIEMQKAAALDEKHERGDLSAEDDVIDLNLSDFEEIPDDTKTKAEKLAEAVSKA